MPYIITTLDGSRTVYNSETGISEYEVESRRAVATLDEARRVAEDASCDSNGYARVDVYGRVKDDAMPVTLGPLPDGTVIEVVRRSWTFLGGEVDMAGTPAELLDAYNAAQGS